MVELPNPQTARVQMLLGAFASWFFALWLVGLPFLFSRPYFFGGLFISAAIWGVVLTISMALKCPHCGKSIAFAKQPPRLGPQWQVLRRQFFPVEAIIGKADTTVCPHCNTRLAINMGAKSGI